MTGNKGKNRLLSRLEFWKMQGGGNDFVVIDNRAELLPGPGRAGLLQKICRRALGVGADGLILLENSGTGDFSCRFFNPDGSEAEMCGNGGRCAARFAFLQGLAPAEMVLQTLAGPVRARVAGGRVRLEMPKPRDQQPGLTLSGEGFREELDFVNTGVPHAVVLVGGDLAAVDVAGRGRWIRRHPRFAPAGTNVNFVQVVDKQRLLIRTYERGVEAETLACGTGSAAAALLCGARGLVESPVEIVVGSGEKLMVWFAAAAGLATEVFLEGGALIIYKGVMEKEFLESE